MERYDYHEAVKADVLEYIRENVNFSEFETLEDLAESLQDDLWTVDSVTGNGSGSYTFSRWKAEEYICHNLDLLGEAMEEFGSSGDILRDGAETADVTIRCYLLGEAIGEALRELGWEFNEAHEAQED